MRGRIDIIDGFRGICILSVLGFHYFVRWAPPFWARNIYGFAHVYPQFLQIGALGVEVFFVISGLVIALTLSECRSALEFAVKRFSRLWPAFAVAATTTFVVTTTWSPPVFRVGLSDYFCNLTMVPSMLGCTSVDGSYWSLAVEVTFYVMAAIGFMLMREDFWKFLVAVGVIGTIAAAFNHRGVATCLLSQFMPLFLVGVAAWLMLLAGRRTEGAVTLAIAAVLYAADARFFLAPILPNARFAGGLYVAGLSAAMILMVAFFPSARLEPLRFIGRISYSVYLLHQFIGVTIIAAVTRLGVPDLMAVTAAVAVSLFLGWLSYIFVEGPGRIAMLSLYRRSQLGLRRAVP